MKNSSKALRLAGLLACAALAAPAAAQDLGGLYLGASIGQANYKYSCQGVAAECDDKDTGYKLFGGYQSSRGVAVEFGYGNFGEVTVEGVGEATVKAGDLSAVFAWRVAQRMALTGRVGVYRAQVEEHFDTGESSSDHNSGWTFGLGAEVILGPKFSLRGEWQRYNNVGGTNTGEDDIDYLSVGFVSRF